MENNNEKFNQEIFDILNTKPTIEEKSKNEEPTYVIDRHKSRQFKEAKFKINNKLFKAMALTFGTAIVFSTFLPHKKNDEIIPVNQPEVTVTTFTASPDYEKVENIPNNFKRDVSEVGLEKTNTEPKLIDLFSVGNNEYIDYINKYIEDDEYQYFEKYAKMYGVPAKVMVAIAMQESTLNHNACIPGGKYYTGSSVGILQLELNCNNSVSAYNYETNEVETAQYTDTELCDLERNIQVSCMLFQNSIEKYHGNIYLAIQAHNYGPVMIDRALEITALKYNSSVDNIIDNYQDTRWLEIVEDIHNNPNKYLSNWSYDTYGGGKNYLYNILSYCPDENVSYKYDNKNVVLNLKYGSSEENIEKLHLQ